MACLTEAEFNYWLDVYEGRYDRPKETAYQAARRRALEDYMRPPDPYRGNPARRRALEQYTSEHVAA